jgi:ADP-ribose pyrophosphatase
MSASKHKIIDIATFKVTDKESGYDKEVLIKKVRLPNGVLENFFVDQGRDSVQIFAIDSENRVHLVRQWRPGEEKEALEVPGGGLDKPNEDTLKAAQRELAEETGLTSNDWVHLGSVSYNPYQNGKRHLFAASNCKKTEKLDLDANEFLNVEVYELFEVKNLIKDGSIRGTDLIYMALDKLGLLGS